MANITSLPVEIVETIADCIPLESPVRQNDIASLRTTCQYVNDILAPRVLSAVTLDLSDWRNVRHLIWMAAGPNRVHKFARTLKIKSIAPSNNASHLAPDIVVEMGGSYRYIDEPTMEDVIQAIQMASHYLPEALHHFHDLESVEWNTDAFDAPSTNQVVMDMLCSQENLRSVCIDMSRDLTFPFPQLHALSNLSEFSVTFPRIHIEAGPLFIGVAEVLRNSPGLISLQVIFQADYRHKDVQDRHKIYTQMASLDQVKKLSLQAIAPQDLVNFFTPVHMGCLTSLEIRPEYGTEGLGRVWNSLKEKGIHLKNICFNILDMETAFVQYISSYSGVEELWLSNKEKYWINLSLNHTDLATGFLDAIVENHSDTLQVLEIYRYYSTAWGNVHERVSKLARLRALRRLGIELPRVEMAFIAASNSHDYRRLRDLLGFPVDLETQGQH